MSDYKFDAEQKRIDDLKKEKPKRMADSAIQEIIDELREKGREDKVAFRPLVALEYNDGEEIPRHEIVDAVTYSDLPGRNRLAKELKSGRVNAIIVEGALRLVRA